ATLSYVLVNPEVLSRFNRQAQDSEIASESPDAAGVGQPQSPDLSSQEFVELDLDTLSTLEARKAADTQPSDAKPGGEAKPETDTETSVKTSADASADGDSNSEGTAVAPGNAPRSSSTTQPLPTRVVTAPVRSNAAPSTAAANPTSSSTNRSTGTAASAPSTPSTASQSSLPQVAAQPSPAPGAGTYYVVADYTGDQALSNARNVVGDAFVRNFSEGARIQLGAFQDESRAQELIQELERQGIPARVQSP
ncbi:MAG: SPOR domain-containing protein, partial [Cyanobacteria bacterium P01_F01_bin.42]